MVCRHRDVDEQFTASTQRRRLRGQAGGLRRIGEHIADLDGIVVVDASERDASDISVGFALTAAFVAADDERGAADASTRRPPQNCGTRPLRSAHSASPRKRRAGVSPGAGLARLYL